MLVLAAGRRHALAGRLLQLSGACALSIGAVGWATAARVDRQAGVGSGAAVGRRERQGWQAVAMASRPIAVVSDGAAGSRALLQGWKERLASTIPILLAGARTLEV